MCEYKPLVSVIIPAYNHERFIEKAIRSIWGQTYSRLEIIVVNDGSTDGTGKVIRRLVPESPCELKFVDKKNQGVSATLNHGITLAEGEFVSFLASDDYYDRRYIEEFVETARKRPDCDVFHCDAYEVDEDGVVGSRISDIGSVAPAHGKCFFKILEGRERVIPSTLMVRYSLFDRVGLFDETLVQEDLDFHLRAAKETSFCYIDKALFFSRKVMGSLGRNPRKWIGDGELAINKHRDYIGDRYVEIMNSKFKRNVMICLSGSDYNGAFVYFKKAFFSCRSSNDRAIFLFHFSKSFSYFYIRNCIFKLTPPQSRLSNYLRGFIRKMRK